MTSGELQLHHRAVHYLGRLSRSEGHIGLALTSHSNGDEQLLLYLTLLPIMHPNVPSLLIA